MRPEHKHLQLWNNYHKTAMARGKLICQLLQKYLSLAGKNILDVGCGYGGASIAIAQAGAHVTAIDQDASRLQILQEFTNVSKLPIVIIHNTIEKAVLPAEFDAIVLWDVLEHLDSPDKVLRRLYHALKPEGILLIATPNRISPINIIADPHYGLPILALLSREKIKTIVATMLGWHDQLKTDYPQLLSLRQLALFLNKGGFRWRFCHHQVIRLAMKNPEAVWCNPLHLKIINRCKDIFNHEKLDYYLSTDINPFNRFIMPTFYIIGGRR